MDDRFLDMFYEEARELLMVLEEGLMELESRQGDRAFVDKVFRAAHSIKGAAAMVGLGSIAGFTDRIETVLDKIRSQTVQVDSQVISVLLEARDQLTAQVEAAAGGDTVEPSPQLLASLDYISRPASERVQLVEPGTAEPAKATQEAAGKTPPESTEPVRPKRKRKPSKKKPDADESAAAKLTDDAGSSDMNPPVNPPAPAESTGEGSPKGFRIRFAPGREALKRGLNPLGVLDELTELGEAFLTVDPSNVPTLDAIDPQLSYLAWEIELRTDEPIERVQDVFLFVSGECRVEITPLASQPASAFDAASVMGETPGIATEARTRLLPGSEPATGVAPVKPEASPDRPADEPATAKPGMRPVPSSEAPSSSGNSAENSRLPGQMAGALLPESAEALSKINRSASSRAASAGTAATATRTSSATRIRVDASQLDDLVGLAGELAVLADNLQGLRDIHGAESYRMALESLERVCRQVRDQSLELRMVPVEELFSRFPRLIRDLADKSGKEIQLRMEGQETRLDRTIVEKLAEPMIHLIRNSVDHGLETPAEREAAGKPRQGRIVLWAGHEGDRVALKIEDDGRGLNRHRILEKGIARGLIPANTSPDDPRVVGLIFEPGFSTRDTVSEISGRGVGLDVVRDAVRALRGSVSVQSEPGRGTCFTFRLPLTLALIDGLLVEVAHEKYVVPLSQVEECVALGGTRPALSSGRMCVSVRDELVPLVDLRKLFEARSPKPKRQEILLTRHGGQRVGVAVDRLLGRVQAVIQSLGDGLSHLGRFSGATILGDGAVSLILDLTAIVGESRAAEIRLDMAAAGSKPEVIS
ncbi:chemotaxis protein CheA [bacterium]|nr:chemotaxis protein CheA [bacterium]